MNLFRIQTSTDGRWLVIGDTVTSLQIVSADLLASMDIRNLEGYAADAVAYRNQLHRLAANTQLDPEAEYTLRTVDWLAAESKRQLKQR